MKGNRRALRLLGITAVVAAVALVAAVSLIALLDNRRSDEAGVLLRGNDGEVTLETKEIERGGEVVVTASQWNDGPLAFYLLTEEQYRDASLLDWDREAVRLDEVTLEPGGTLEYRFRLDESYRAQNGRELGIEPGQRLFVAAGQLTEGGGHGAGAGTLLVLP